MRIEFSSMHGEYGELSNFRQHPQLGALLRATGDAVLVEHTENDDYWGDGGDGSGGNHLGRILMAVRATL